jgi:hypothetical protein
MLLITARMLLIRSHRRYRSYSRPGIFWNCRSGCFSAPSGSLLRDYKKIAPANEAVAPFGADPEHPAFIRSIRVRPSVLDASERARELARRFNTAWKRVEV